MLQRKIFAGIGLALLLGSSPVYAAPFPSLANDVGVCDPNNPSHCIAPDASGNVPITGTITASLGGFTPSASGARGTPLSVTTSDSSGTLPTGAVTIVSNAGTTNPMYCNINGVAATTSDQLIGANSWFAFTIPAAITTLHCIATGGTTTANMLGGAGLATGAGGGSGGSGGGGAITAAIGSYAAGALSAGAFATGAGVDGWDLTQGAKADVAWASGSGSVIALLKAIATAEIVTNRAVNVAQINGVTPLMGNGVTGTGSPRVTIASDNTPFAVTTNPTTAANWGIGTSTQNSATVANGQLALGQFNTAPTTITTGNMSPMQLDNSGKLLVNCTGCSSSSAITSWAGGTLGAMANYGTSPGAVLVPGFNAFVTNASPGIANNADAIAAVAAGATSPVAVNNYGYVFNGTTWDRMRSGTQTGSVAVASADPCLGANKTNLPISQNGTASVQLVALSGATSIYVCSLSLIAAGATTVALTTGTGSACVTGNAAVIGTTTASIANSMSLAANGGLTLGNGAGTIAKGAASSELCMVLGTSVFVSGNLTFVQQ